MLLTERVQREKAELTDRLAALAAENRNLQSMLDPAVVERRVAEAAAAAKEAAETQAAIEAEALRKRILEMETFVEEADAKALQASGRVAHLQAQLAGAKGAGPGGTGVVDGWEEVRAAEERADALSLELQYAKAECRSLEQDVRSAKAEADRAIM